MTSPTPLTVVLMNTSIALVIHLFQILSQSLTPASGRTARIGNIGLATSFYNDRNEDIASDLVKVLIETKQPVPDFLQLHAPEDGKVTFDDDTDSEFGEEINGATGTATGEATGGNSFQELKSAQAEDAWGPKPTTAPAASSWGVEPTAPANAWTAPADTEPAPAAAW